MNEREGKREREGEGERERSYIVAEEDLRETRERRVEERSLSSSSVLAVFSEPR